MQDLSSRARTRHPRDVKQLARHRLLKFKLKSFAVALHAEMVRIGIRNRLNVRPSPTSASTAFGCQVINPAIAKSQHPVGAAPKGAAVEREAMQSWRRLVQASRFPPASRPGGRTLRRRQAAPRSRGGNGIRDRWKMPAPVLVSFQIQATGCEVEALNFRVTPPQRRAFARLECDTLLVDHQCSAGLGTGWSNRAGDCHRETTVVESGCDCGSGPAAKRVP